MSARHAIVLWLPLASALLVAAAPTVPVDWLAQGDSALAAGDLEQALADYRRAAERTTDPGLAAFNQGVCLYQLGRFREAELLFRCALDDAGVSEMQRGPESQRRRGRALYNLGNCLLKESGGRDRSLLGDAAACYDLCLVDPHADGELLIDARHNMELAKLLRMKARATAAEPERDDGPPDQVPPPREPFGGEPPGPDGQRPDGSTGQAQPAPGTAPDTGQNGPKNPLPGSGHLPPIPDSDELAPMTPEDLAAHLKAAEERIRRERDERLRPRVVVPPTVRNW